MSVISARKVKCGNHKVKLITWNAETYVGMRSVNVREERKESVPSWTLMRQVRD